MIVRLKELDAQLAARLLESHLQLKNPNLKRKSTKQITQSQKFVREGHEVTSPT